MARGVTMTSLQTASNLPTNDANTITVTTPISDVAVIFHDVTVKPM